MEVEERLNLDQNGLTTKEVYNQANRFYEICKSIERIYGLNNLPDSIFDFGSGFGLFKNYLEEFDLFNRWGNYRPRYLAYDSNYFQNEELLKIANYYTESNTVVSDQDLEEAKKSKYEVAVLNNAIKESVNFESMSELMSSFLSLDCRYYIILFEENSGQKLNSDIYNHNYLPTVKTVINLVNNSIDYQYLDVSKCRIPGITNDYTITVGI